MKKNLLLVFTIISIATQAQRIDSTQASGSKYALQHYFYSPGHYLKLAGNDLLIGTCLSIASTAAIVIIGESNNAYSGNNPNVIYAFLAIFGEIFSLIEYISAGVNLREAGKRMIELKMGLSSNTNGIGVSLVF